MQDSTVPPSGFALFDTAIGRCGVAWSSRGIARITLPEVSDSISRERLARSILDGAEVPPPPAIAAAIEQIVAHVRGEPAALDELVLDMSGVPPFYCEVYTAARRIPRGQTVSYGALAQSLGKPDTARAVGQALGANPFPIVVPCHRVLAANHATGGFSAHGGVATKARLLAAEGFTLPTQPELPLGAPPPRRPR